jgi:hypothetical protein
MRIWHIFGEKTEREKNWMRWLSFISGSIPSPHSYNALSSLSKSFFYLCKLTGKGEVKGRAK